MTAWLANRWGDERWRSGRRATVRALLGTRSGRLVLRPKMARLTLRFANDELERRFTSEHLALSMPVIRLALFFGTLIYGFFGILDRYIMPDVLVEMWIIRYGFICSILFLIFLLTYTPYFHRASQLLLSIAMLAAGLGILGMVAIANAPGSYYYYAGLIVVLIYCLTLIRLRFAYAAAISLALFGLYQIVATVINPLPMRELANNDSFLGVALAVGLLSAYAQEFYIRYNFLNNDLLRREKTRSDRLLVEARAANEAKTQFLATMSHELRTPLNAILGFSEAIQQKIFGPLGSERYEEYIDDIHDSGGHLLRIINDILDLSKAESGEIILNEERVDVCEMLDQCLRMFREQAADKGVRLGFEAPASRPILRADSRLFNQVAINLLSNAIKFTEIDGAVVVSVACEDGGDCCVRFRDTGIGIAEEDLAKVLEPFVQVECAFSRKHEGTGLGLPLVKQMMELHGGRLEIESEPGAGVTATARFPAERVIARRDAATPALEDA